MHSIGWTGTTTASSAGLKSSARTSSQSDLFGGLDANNDEVITPDEWQWSRRSFARQDQNGDGQLTRRELTNAELQSQETSLGGRWHLGAGGHRRGRARVGRHRTRSPARRPDFDRRQRHRDPQQQRIGLGGAGRLADLVAAPSQRRCQTTRPER